MGRLFLWRGRRVSLVAVIVLGITGWLAYAVGTTGAAGLVAYPDSIAVLGHSGATGESSDPKRPHVEVRANSWATGTNPAVNSVYLRILAKNPRIKGHNLNLAQGGATVSRLLGQAQVAVQERPLPELILVQIMDNDIVCPAAAGDYGSFHAGLRRALQTLTAGAPHSTIFLVSQFGSPGTYARAFPPSERLTIGGGTRPCDFIDPSGNIVPAKVRTLDRAIHGYENELRATCAQFEQCRYDGGAFGRVIDKRQYISATDPNHLSIRGHAKAAAVAWTALQRAGIIPHG